MIEAAPLYSTVTAFPPLPQPHSLAVGYHEARQFDKALPLFERRPVAPTLLRDKPFGENVEGLSCWGNEVKRLRDAAQKLDFEDSTPFDVVSG